MTRSEEEGDGRIPVPDHPAGLCSVCVHHRVTGNRRGSRFWLCRRSETDPRFRRYPPLPMMRCPGFEPQPDDPWARYRGPVDPDSTEEES